MADLTRAAFNALGIQEAHVLTEDYAISQQVGRIMRDAGLSGILVPAAIHRVPRTYPTFRVQRDHSVLTVVAPQSGRNLVIVDPDGLQLDEIERYTCTVEGLPQGL